MLSNTVTYLLFIAIVSLLKFRQRFENFIAAIVLFAATWVFYLFMTDWDITGSSTFTLLWDSSRSGDIKIDIVSSFNNYQLVFPFFVITIIALIHNLFFRYEDKKRNLSAILILNLISFIML